MLGIFWNLPLLYKIQCVQYVVARVFSRAALPAHAYDAHNLAWRIAWGLSHYYGASLEDDSHSSISRSQSSAKLPLPIEAALNTSTTSPMLTSMTDINAQL